MNYLLSIARGSGWALAFIGLCLVLYPVFSFFARIGIRGLDRTFSETYVMTGSLLHLPLIVVLGLVAYFVGFHILGWADHRKKQTRLE